MTKSPIRCAKPSGANPRPTFTGLALAASLALVACGGGNNDNDSTSSDTVPAASPAASAVTPSNASTGLSRSYLARTAADFGGMTPEVFNSRGDLAGTKEEEAKTYALLWSDGKLQSSWLIRDCSACITGYGHAYPSLNVLDENRHLFAAWVGKQGLEGQTSYLREGSDIAAMLNGCHKVYGASDAGEVLCDQATNTPQKSAGLWDLKTLSFTVLNGGETAINPAGTRAGVAAVTSADEGTPIHRVFIDQAGKVSSADLHGYSSAQVTRINAQNQVIGQRTLPGDVGPQGSFDPSLTQPFVWTPGSEPANLPCPSAYGVAQAINRHGIIIGACLGAVDGSTPGRVALWKDGQLVDLDAHMRTAAGWTLSAAWAINDLGWILGRGRRVGSEAPEENVVLIPQP